MQRMVHLKWKFKTGIDTVYYNQVGFQSSPVVYNGIVYSGCRDAHVWAIEAETGDLKWKYYNNGSWVIATPVVYNDTLYYETSDSHKINALSAVSGKLLYSGDCKTYGFSSPALTNGILYLGTHGGSMMALETKTGNVTLGIPHTGIISQQGFRHRRKRRIQLSQNIH